jgi:radical SAM protein with 4Fe4S-binding SPASM domain
VLPKVLQILGDFPGKVDISVPVSKSNLGELPQLRSYFLQRGARGVHFDTLSSRCADDPSIFHALALDPQPKRCGPDRGRNLIVDCDGKVLICCEDFRREEPIGDLREESLLSVLLSAQRREMMEQFRTGRHAERKTCSKCYSDFKRKGEWQQLVNESLLATH